MPKAKSLDVALQYLKSKVPQAGFFSTLDELIQNSPQERMPAEQWQNYLKPGQTLTREGVKFPLKAEELQYSGLPEFLNAYTPQGSADSRANFDLMHRIRGGLSDSDPYAIPRDVMLDHLRRSRPEFNLKLGISDPFGGNPEQLLQDHLPQESKILDDSFDHYNGRYARSQPTLTNAQFKEYAHTPSVPNSYQESITTSPHFGSFPSHFSPSDVSWSRTTRHYTDPSDFDLRDAIFNRIAQPQGPTARLVEEIQSDRHEAAAEKIHQLTPDQEEEKNRISQTLQGMSSSWEDPARDELAARLEALQNSTNRRGYRSPEDESHAQALQRAGVRDRYDPTPPDTPFKDPADYALLELKKQLLNSANEGDRYLALTRGSDQAERWGMNDQDRGQGMKYIYDQVYPGALKKLATQYGAPVKDINLQTVGKNEDVRTPIMRDFDADRPSDVVHGADDTIRSSPPDLGGFDQIHQLIDEMKARAGNDADQHSYINQAIEELDNYKEEHKNLETGSPGDKEFADSHMNEYMNRVAANLDAAHEVYMDQAYGAVSNKSFPAMEIDPELSEKIKRIGVPLWTLAGASALGGAGSNDANATPVEDQAMQDANGLAEGGQVTFALRRLLAQLKEMPEVMPAEKAAQVLERGDAVLPKPNVDLPPPSQTRRMSDQIMENGRPGVRAPATAQQLAARLRGADLVEPTELNHLLYADPETNSAINAYQGDMDRSVVDQRPVDPAIKEQLAQALDKHAQAPASVLNPQDDTAMAEGGDVRSSSPGSPGIGGAVKDAVDAARDYFIARPGRELAAQGQQTEDHVVNGFDPIAAARARLGFDSGGSVQETPYDVAEDQLRNQAAKQTGNTQYVQQDQALADGGKVDGPSTEHEDPDSSLAKIGDAGGMIGPHVRRLAVGIAKQAYGLDKDGKVVLGGRAWTPDQGGTPAGILDELASAPHSLISLAKTVRGLDPLRKIPGYGAMQEGLDKGLDAMDPQWSQDASDRLDRLRSAVNSQTGIGEPQGPLDYITDAAASLVSPIPMTKAGEEASALKRILEMTTPLRPRTMQRMAGDTAVLGTLGAGTDALGQRLAQLRAQNAKPAAIDPNDMRDPTQFSGDMGVHPEEGTIYPPINRTAGMRPLYDSEGRQIGSGIPPETM